MPEILREDAGIASKMNNGKCAAHYEKNSYVCVCAKEYSGKYCETGSVLCVIRNGTRRKKKQNNKKKNKAELVCELSP